MDHWSRALLAANDVDYAPVLDSLHRLGKVVSVIGRRTRDGSALERRGHDFHGIPESWLALDLAAFRCFRNDGALDRLLRTLRERGFKCGCRRVMAEERTGWGFHHDFEVIVSHEAGQHDAVADLVVHGLKFPRLFKQNRNAEMTVFTLDFGGPVLTGIARHDEDGAAWRAETTHVFPAHLVDRPAS